MFGQAQSVERQNAYLHLISENYILEEAPHLREEVIRLKNQGYKTEPAFCKVLGLEGDPYEKLLEYGEKKALFKSVSCLDYKFNN